MNEVRIMDEQTDDPEKVQVGRLDEHTETERLERAAEHIGQIDQLRPEVWSGLSETEREVCLRRAGQHLSEAYECPAPPFIGSRMAESDRGVLLGAYSDPEYLTRINRELLTAKDGQQALSTFCHEFRHSYQHEMAGRYGSAFSHLCHDKEASAAWAENLKPSNYVSFEEDPARYEAQPVERDARDFAARIQEQLRRQAK